MRAVIDEQVSRGNHSFRFPSLSAQGIAVTGSSTVSLILFYMLFAAPDDFGTVARKKLMMAALLWVIASSISSMSMILVRAHPYRYGCVNAMLRDRLFQVFGWGCGIGLGVLTYNFILHWLTKYIFGSYLENLAGVGAILLCVVVTFSVGIVIHTIPNWIAINQLKGSVTTFAAWEVFSFGAAWFGILMLLNLFPLENSGVIKKYFYAPMFDWLTGILAKPSTTEIFSLAFTATFIYGLIRFKLYSLSLPKAGLWIVVSNNKPHHLTLTIADELCAAWRNGPTTLVAPSDYRSRGEHVYLAEKVAKLRSVFPARKAQIFDWLDTLPPINRWIALPHRELYTSSSLISHVIDQCVQNNDLIVLLCSNTNDFDRKTLTIRPSRIIVISIGSESGFSENLLGFPHIVVKGNKYDVRKSCRNIMKSWNSSTQSTLDLGNRSSICLSIIISIVILIVTFVSSETVEFSLNKASEKSYVQLEKQELADQRAGTIDQNLPSNAQDQLEASDKKLNHSSAEIEVPVLKKFIIPSQDSLGSSHLKKIWFVIVGSHETYEKAKIQADQINREYNEFNAEVYDRFAGNLYYAVVIGSLLSKSDATALKKRAISMGVSKSTYIWTYSTLR